ncbi:MAG TPA: MarR family transcriptional regulator [Candidatus Kapabacteria bacterium]
MTDHNVSRILNTLRILVQSLQIASRNAEKRVGLSGAQLFVLEQLRTAKSMSVNELAAATHTSQSTVSVVVTKLVKKGLVSRVRSEMDQRMQMLSITKAGIQTLRSSPETLQDKLIRVLKKMRSEDRSALALHLDTILTQAGLSGIKPELFLEKSKKNSEFVGVTKGHTKVKEEQAKND